jgi:putative DNA methylase
LKAELPQALAHLQRGNIAPVDLAQAAIGPGMAVYTRYAKVLDAEDKPLSVREALALINQTLDEALAEQEGDFDADTAGPSRGSSRLASLRASTAVPNS